MIGTAHPHTDTRTLHQLARIGRIAGVAIAHEAGGYVATSPAEPATRYVVTGFTCSCPTFIRHDRCIHHAVLLATLDWLPADAADRSR